MPMNVGGNGGVKGVYGPLHHVYARKVHDGCWERLLVTSRHKRSTNHMTIWLPKDKTELANFFDMKRSIVGSQQAQ